MLKKYCGHCGNKTFSSQKSSNPDPVVGQGTTYEHDGDWDGDSQTYLKWNNEWYFGPTDESKTWDSYLKKGPIKSSITLSRIKNIRDQDWDRIEDVTIYRDREYGNIYLDND